MAAPSATVWATLNYDCKIGVYVTVAKTNNTTATVTCQVWGWQYGPSTENYTFLASNMAMNFGTTTLSTKRTFSWTNKTGSGWATANQQLLGTYTQTYTRGTSEGSYSLAAGLYTESASAAFIKVTATYKIPVKAYTISYNANGGSGAPAAQTKDHGVTLALSATVPAQSGYTFQKWNTAQNGSGTNYAPKANYTNNANATLYAQWKTNYKVPTISGVKCYRSNSSGAASDEELYGHFEFSWSVETTTYTSNVGKSYKISYKINGGSDFTDLYTGTLSGTSGSVSYTSTKGVFGTDNTYSILITVTDNYDSSFISSFISSAYYIMDFKDGGKGIAIGGAAMDDNLTIHLPTVINNNLTVGVSGSNRLQINSYNLSYDSTPSEYTYDASLYIYSKTDDHAIGFLRGIHTGDGWYGIELSSLRYVNDTGKYSTLRLEINGDGVRGVDTRGDRITLTKDSARIFMAEVNGVYVYHPISSSTNPGSNTYSNGFHLFSSADSSDWAYFKPCKMTDSRQGFQLEARRYINSAWAYSTILGLIDSSGKRTINITADTIYLKGNVSIPRKATASTTASTITVDASKTYLIYTAHNSVQDLNGMWIARLGSNTVFKIAGGANVTITASGNNKITVKTGSGTVEIFMMQLGG